MRHGMFLTTLHRDLWRSFFINRQHRAKLRVHGNPMLERLLARKEDDVFYKVDLTYLRNRRRTIATKDK